MKFLVTGGNGFIGSYLCKALKSDGHQVISLGKADCNNIQLDLSKTYHKFNDDFDYVVHTASIVHNTEHATSLNGDLILSDISITENLIKSLEAVTFKKIIFLSSVSVYGIKSGSEIDVNQPTKPIEGYGLSKLINEKILQSKINSEKLLILRLPLVNGPSAKGNIKKLQEALSNKRMILFKNNPSVKSILELNDLYRFISTKSLLLTGVHQIKSYDQSFNDFTLSLSATRPFFVPIFILDFGVKISKTLNLTRLYNTLTKISSTLTFKNSSEL